MLHKNNYLEKLKSKFDLKEFNFENIEDLDILSKKSLELIQQNGGKLSEIPPLEKHPYIEPIDGSKITGLMIGTFPPISYLCDTLDLDFLSFNGKISPPIFPYFHGNYSSLWKYCPLDINLISSNSRSLQPELLKNSLLKNKIAYTDIILFCQRKLREENGTYSYTAEDKLLNNIHLNYSLFNLLTSNENINRLYFTNASFFGSNNRNNFLFNKSGEYILDERDAFRLFLKGAVNQGFKIDVAKIEEPDIWFNINEGHRSSLERKKLNELLITTIIFKLRLIRDENVREFMIYSAVSPAAVNRGMVRKNNCVIKFSESNNIGIDKAPQELLKSVLKSFFNDDTYDVLKYNYTV